MSVKGEHYASPAAEAKHEAVETHAEQEKEYVTPAKTFMTYDALQAGAPGKAAYNG